MNEESLKEQKIDPNWSLEKKQAFLEGELIEPKNLIAKAKEWYRGQNRQTRQIAFVEIAKTVQPDSTSGQNKLPPRIGFRFPARSEIHIPTPKPQSPELTPEAAAPEFIPPVIPPEEKIISSVEILKHKVEPGDTLWALLEETLENK